MSKAIYQDILACHMFKWIGLFDGGRRVGLCRNATLAQHGRRFITRGRTPPYAARGNHKEMLFPGSSINFELTKERDCFWSSKHASMFRVANVPGNVNHPRCIILCHERACLLTCSRLGVASKSCRMQTKRRSLPTECTWRSNPYGRKGDGGAVCTGGSSCAN